MHGAGAAGGGGRVRPAEDARGVRASRGRGREAGHPPPPPALIQPSLAAAGTGSQCTIITNYDIIGGSQNPP